MPAQVELDAEQTSLLQRAAEAVGQTLEQYLSALAAKEAQRLWHIERSKPKPKEAPKPVGRPKMSPEERELSSLGAFFLGIYQRLRLMHGENYERLFGEQEKHWRQLVENKDVRALNAYAKEQPWQKRRS